MPERSDNLSKALNVMNAEGLDALSPEEMARLEGILNSEPHLAADWADRTPSLDDPLATHVANLDSATAPSRGEWERVWQTVDAEAYESPDRMKLPARVIRLWRPLTAVAACILLLASWQIHRPIKLARNVEISELEVYGGATPFVVSIGDEDGPQVIWVLEDES